MTNALLENAAAYSAVVRRRCASAYRAGVLLVRVRRLVERRVRPLAPSVAAERLTKRELEILQLLADGLRYRQIAAQLFISPRRPGPTSSTSSASSAFAAMRRQLLSPTAKRSSSRRPSPPLDSSLSRTSSAGEIDGRCRVRVTRLESLRGLGGPSR